MNPAAVRAIGHFDEEGRLVRWPARRAVQRLVLWALWTRFAPDTDYDERAVGEILKAAHLYGDHVSLRRSLVDEGLLWRTADGRVYRRVEREADDEAAAVLRAYAGRSVAGGA